MTSTIASPHTAPTRRELLRRYKDAPPPMGVYAVRNRIDRRVLLGASNNVEGTLNRHRFELSMKQHRNARLLEDWLRLGAENFTFEVIDRVKPRADPAFDYAAELDAMLALWREEFWNAGDESYDPAIAQGIAR